MRAVLAAMIIASLATPALAQDTHVPRYGEEDKEKTATQKAAEKADADAYKRSLGAIPDKGPTDPWGNVRTNSAPKPTATKTAKTKAKTGGAEAKTGSAEAKPQ